MKQRKRELLTFEKLASDTATNYAAALFGVAFALWLVGVCPMPIVSVTCLIMLIQLCLVALKDHADGTESDL